jgi:uncharacterized protein YabN with tetrapyrrole methylase and pyrophosphatase domain
MTIWERVRNWGKLRGIDGVDSQTQYQRFLQEAVEIHDAMIKHDKKEIVDAIGDTIVTLINLANTYNLKAEDCLDAAFSVIEYRKGLTTDKGDFIRYAKLTDEQKFVCDIQQGERGSEYFSKETNLKPINFKE